MLIKIWWHYFSNEACDLLFTSSVNAC